MTCMRQAAIGLSCLVNFNLIPRIMGYWLPILCRKMEGFELFMDIFSVIMFSGFMIACVKSDEAFQRNPTVVPSIWQAVRPPNWIMWVFVGGFFIDLSMLLAIPLWMPKVLATHSIGRMAIETVGWICSACIAPTTWFLLCVMPLPPCKGKVREFVESLQPKGVPIRGS